MKEKLELETAAKQKLLAESIQTSKLHSTILLHDIAFDHSAQANVISIVSSGKIVDVNNAACKLLGYSKKELLTKNGATIFDVHESSFKKMLKQRKAEGQSVALATAIKKSGKTFPCEISSAVFRDEDGIEKSITSIADMTLAILKQKNIDTVKEKLLAENTENFKLIFNSTADVLFDVDLITNTVEISDSYEKKFGYKITRTMTPEEAVIRHIHPDDREAVRNDYLRMLASTAVEWNNSYRFLKADNSVVHVFSHRIILRNADGKAYRMIGSMQDINKQKVLEERLEQEIKLKEKQIEDAATDAKDTERSDIGKELHDNINQLLGASKLYIDMANRGGENSKTYLSQSSKYTMEAIEEIRKLTKGLTTDTIKNLGLCEAIENITVETMKVNPVKITCAMKSFIEKSVNDKFKLNVYRIVQEQLNNILKHARATEVRITLLQNKKSIMLSISDNGVGFDTAKKRDGIGVANIKSRATSYNGTADFVSQPGQGCVLQVKFPVSDALLKMS